MRKAALLFVLIAAAALPVRGQFLPESVRVYRGEPVEIPLPPSADTLLVTYRPSSAIARRVMLPASGGGAVRWTPTDAGVVALSTPGGPSQNVSVRFRGIPIGGLVVLLFAGTVLFGGAAFALKKLFEDDPPPQT